MPELNPLNKIVIPKPATLPAAVTPATKAFSNPTDAKVVEPVADTSQFGYKAPVVPAFSARNVNQGLLEYDPSNSSALKLDSHGVDTSKLGVKVDGAPTYAQGSGFIEKGALVENRVKGLLDPTNDLNKQVLGQTSAQMQGRGFLDSSVSATAGQNAMLDKALSIATPDAQTISQADLTRQNATYSSQKAIQDTQNQGSLAQQTTGLQGAINTQNAAIDQDKLKLQGAITGDLNTQNANIAGETNTQAAGYQRDAALTAGLLEGAAKTQAGKIQAEMISMQASADQTASILESELQNSRLTTQAQNDAIMETFRSSQTTLNNQMNLEYNRITNQANLNGNERTQLATQMQKMSSDYGISVQNVLLDKNMTASAKNAAIANLTKLQNDAMAGVAAIFGVAYVKPAANAPLTTATAGTPATTTPAR